MQNYGISVVICTHNRRKHLLEVIKSLKKIKHPIFRVIVIDSSDKNLNKKEQKLVDIYIYVKNKKALSEKRNIAIKKLKSNILIFTDDDCIATSDWVEELTKPFSQNTVVCVTGRTLPYTGYKKSDYEKKFSFDKIGTKYKIIKKHYGIQNLWRFGHGNNMAFRSVIFTKVGLFDTNLGVGSKGLRAEDVDMFYRIYRAGYKIVYNPNAIVLHKHLVKKQELPWQSYANGYASKLVLFKNLDMNTISLYIGGVIKLYFKFLFSSGFRRKVNLQLLKGWLGLR